MTPTSTSTIESDAPSSTPTEGPDESPMAELDRPLRVLLIHQAFAGPGEAGGTRHYELGRRCVAEGDRFTVVASSVSYLTGQRTTVFREQLDGVAVRRAWAPATHNRSFVWRVVSFLGFMASAAWTGLRAGRADVVVGTTPPIFQAVSAWLVAALRRVPFVLEVRDLWPEFAIDMGVLKNPLLIRASRWLARFLHARATRIVVNSPAYRDHLIDKGVDADKIDLVPNGAHPYLDRPQAEGEAWRARHGFQPEQTLVVYAGALGVANDLGTLLEAADALRDVEDLRIVLVGDGKERPRLEAMARERQLTNVAFTGAVAKHEMRDVLASADICVASLQDIPMFRMPYPNKVFDYMAAGRPIVLAIDGVIRDVVEAAGCGLFVPPGDAAALAATIHGLAGNPRNARAMGLRGRDHVVRHFHRDDQARQFRRVLHRAAGE